MKTHLLFRWLFTILLIIPFLLTGQDWQNICTSGKTFYVSPSNKIEGIYFTGVAPGSNNDTLYTTFNHWRNDPVGYSLQINKSPIFLKKILKEQNGWFTFYELLNADTVFKVRLNTQAKLNDTWLFFYEDYYSYEVRVDATVTEIGTDTILGYIDSVKVMTLQRKDMAGNPISDPINGKQVILGKSLGLVQIIDFYNMLQYRTQYNLAGKTKPDVGIHELTGREIFDFQPGDVFNYSGRAYTEYTPPPYGFDYTYQESREILEKDSTASGYKYKILKCIKATGTPSFQFKGITELNISYGSFTSSPFSKLPMEVLSSTGGGSYYAFHRVIKYDGRQEKQIAKCGICCNQYGCFEGMYACEYCYPDDYNLASGIGITHIKFQEEAGPFHHNQDLVYFKKGNYTYGNPNIDCPPFGYRLIPLKGNTYYSDGSGNMKVLNVDSAQVLSGTDSIFYTFPAIRKIQGVDCYDTSGGSIFGRKIIQGDLAIYQLLNNQNDTLKILTAYDPGTKWTFCNLPDGNRIEATILSKYADTILGVPDTVKIIQFQAKNINGQNISHIMNGKEMELSNLFGFSKMYDFTLLPDSLVKYTLTGSDIPVAGMNDLSWDRIYNFDEGDQFGYTGFEMSGTDSIVIKTNRTILDRTISGNNDTLTYKCAICKRSVRYTADGDSVVKKVKDTVNLVYTSDSFLYQKWIDKNPDEFYSQNNSGKTLADRYFMYDSSEYSGRQLRGGEYHAFERSGDGCWIPANDTSSYIVSYADGLGEVERKSVLTSPDHYYTEKLAGYTKQNESWGIIPDVNCMPSPGLKDQQKPAGIRVKIVPSPVKTSATVIIENSRGFLVADFSLCDLTGKEVLLLNITGKETSFNRQNLPSGLYIWKFILDNVVLTGKVVFE